MEERTDEQREQSQRLHQQSQKLYDKQQNALCFVVIGSILVIIGLLFIFLALKRENNVLVGFNKSSLAYYIMIIFSCLGAVLLIFGVVKLSVNTTKRRKVIKAINELK